MENQGADSQKLWDSVSKVVRYLFTFCRETTLVCSQSNRVSRYCDNPERWWMKLLDVCLLSCQLVPSLTQRRGGNRFSSQGWPFGKPLEGGVVVGKWEMQKPSTNSVLGANDKIRNYQEW